MIGTAAGRKLVAIALALIAVATLIPGSSDAANAVVRSWHPALGDYGLADAIANVALFVPLGWTLTVAGVRPRRVVAKALNVMGEEFTIDALDLAARCIAHETDHLDGELFIEYLSPLKRDLVKRKIKKRVRAGDW